MSRWILLTAALLMEALAGCGRVYPGRFSGSRGADVPIRYTAILSSVDPFIANGTDVANISVLLQDQNGTPVPGVTPVLMASGSGNTLSCGASDAFGTAWCTLTTTVAELKSVRIIDPPATALSIPVTALGGNSFRYLWNAPPGSPTAKLPLIPTETYDIQVLWGDGTSDRITDPMDPKVTHDYTSGSIYTITITGSFSALKFATDPDRLVDVSNWGNQYWTSMKDMFKNCVNLVEFTATDTPDTSIVADFSGMFEGAEGFNARLTGWDTGNAVTFARMFKGAIAFGPTGFDTGIRGWNVSLASDFSEMFSAPGIPASPVLSEPAPTQAMVFNQDLSQWNPGSATTFRRMFAGATEFNSAIGNWTTPQVTDLSMMFYYARQFNQSLNHTGDRWNVSQVTTTEMMFFQAENFNQTLDSWNPGELLTMRRMFAFASRFNRGLNWGGEGATAKLTNLYETFYTATAFNSVVEIDVGRVTDFYRTFAYASAFNQPLTSWYPGKFVLSPTKISFHSFFIGASNFNQPLDHWGQLNQVEFLDYMFRSATAFNQDLSSWTLNSVKSMAYMFSGASSFNNGGAPGSAGPDLIWNLPLVTTLERTFEDAIQFNCRLGWTTPNLQNLRRTFFGATRFNNGGPNGGGVGPAFTLDTGGVTLMDSTFWNAVNFNSPLPWNTASVTTFYAMFYGAEAYDQSMDTSGNTWNVSNATNMASIFYNAIAFNQSLNNWNPIKATTITRMFIGARAFNNGMNCGDVGQLGNPGTSWNTALATNLGRMFEDAVCFNQRIYFNTNSATDIYNMFNGAIRYNQPMPSVGGYWNTESVTNMNGVFFNAAQFNQDISSWVVTSVSTYTNFSGGNPVGWIDALKPNFATAGGPKPTRKVFLTAATYTGDFGGINNADSNCMTDSKYPGSGNYKALIMLDPSRFVQITPTFDELDWPLGGNIRYVRLDGTTEVFSTNSNKVISGVGYTNSIDPVYSGRYWAGFTSSWTPTTDQCLGWTMGTPYLGTSLGASVFTTSSLSCATALPLVCVEQ
jgi:hypothetical protein